MEASVTANMLVPPQSDMAGSSLDDETSDGEMAAAACCSSSDLVDPMLEFSRRLQDIISTYSAAASLLDTQIVMEVETEKMDEKDDITVTTETDISLIMHSLNSLSSPEEKLKDLVMKYAEMAALRRSDEKKLSILQQKLSILLEEKQQLQAERRSSATARVELETLCRELQCHYNRLREETLQRCREDEEKRKEITCHFQKMLTEIQAQIEQHSTRNDKLCRENVNLTDKLESLMNQCEMREESLEKINRHRDLQHKLTEAKLQQANALLTEAEEKHKREKEYLLREAIDKTKKCFAMKEQELAMKKKLTLYAQKFDEFQATLAKSNEIYTRFKKEMDNMTDRMKKMEKESNLWKTRFENCNKALTDMIDERTEKCKEYDLFVLKIQRLEKLCRALQEERKVLYDKIKEVRHSNTNPSNAHSNSGICDIFNSDAVDKCALLKPEEIQDLQDQDPVLTQDMTRLREEQAKLQEFAASLLTTPTDNDEEDIDYIDFEEDMMASAFTHFKTKTQVKEEPVSITEKDIDVKANYSDLPLPDKVEEVQKADVSTPIAPAPEELASEGMSAQPKPEAAQVQTQVEGEEVQRVELDKQQQQPSEQQLTYQAEKVVSAVSTEDEQLQLLTEPMQVSEEAPTMSVSAPPFENMPTTAADSAKMHALKKKKKKSSKTPAQV